jgi:hypothetical protein
MAGWETSELRRRVPPGKTRIIGVDLFAFEEYLVADCDTRAEAVVIADRKNATRSDPIEDVYYVYNDRGDYIRGINPQTGIADSPEMPECVGYCAPGPVVQSEALDGHFEPDKAGRDLLHRASSPATFVEGASKQTRGYMSCQICGANKTTVLAEFSGNIGALVMRFERSIRGNMCRACLTKQFWKFTAMNLLLGWWSFFSVFLTPMHLFVNTVVYLKCLRSLRRHEASKFNETGATP